MSRAFGILLCVCLSLGSVSGCGGGAEDPLDRLRVEAAAEVEAAARAAAEHDRFAREMAEAAARGEEPRPVDLLRRRRDLQRTRAALEQRLQSIDGYTGNATEDADALISEWRREHTAEGPEERADRCIARPRLVVLLPRADTGDVVRTVDHAASGSA